jgi:ubiquinone/menaquinone biosynthesis C-methylase UbiE
VSTWAPHQASLPHGVLGRVFGVLMDVFNASAAKTVGELLAVQRGDSILEIGFGTGNLLRRLARRTEAGMLAGVDPSPLMLRTATRRLAGFDHRIIVDLKLGTADRLDWPDGTFDRAAALHSFQFWSDPQACAREIHRVLKPGGLLILGLRDHSRPATVWLPNPLSRTGDEANAASQLLSEHGFAKVDLSP